MNDMEHLYKKGCKVYYLSSLQEDTVINDIHYISRDLLLGRNTLLKKLGNIFFALRHLTFFGLSIIKNLRKIVGICGTERACIKLIRRYNIQLIHTNFFEPNGESAVLASRICNVPLIATLHGAEIQTMPQFEYGACLDGFYKENLMRSIGYIDYLTVPKICFGKKLESDFGVPSKKIKHIPNGVEKINVKKNGTLNDDLHFISIGNMIKLKNMDIIFNSLEELSREFRFKISIVGSGPLRKKYETIASNKNNLVLYDEMPKSELYKLLSSCDCLIHPSYSEGGPLVVLESLSMGIPCLVSDIPAHHEIIDEGVNGFFFDPYDRNDFVNKMRLILSNRHILPKMKDRCIESSKRFSIESRISAFMELYKRLLKSEL
jgi:glycosyltransferase involved in cell wall biosynthesis